MTLENVEVRKAVAESGQSFKSIAERIGITRQHICRLMAKPLSEENRLRILDALAQLEEGNKGGCDGV